MGAVQGWWGGVGGRLRGRFVLFLGIRTTPLLGDPPHTLKRKTHTSYGGKHKTLEYLSRPPFLKFWIRLCLYTFRADSAGKVLSAGLEVVVGEWYASFFYTVMGIVHNVQQPWIWSIYLSYLYLKPQHMPSLCQVTVLIDLFILVTRTIYIDLSCYWLFVVFWWAQHIMCSIVYSYYYPCILCPNIVYSYYIHVYCVPI